MTLYAPSEDFIRLLYKYHRSLGRAQRKRLYAWMIPAVQQWVGKSVQKSLLTLANQELLDSALNSDFVKIIKNDWHFVDELKNLLNKNLGIESDEQGDCIMGKLEEDFGKWLRGLGGLSKVEDKSWSYTELRLLDCGDALMKLNHGLNLGSKAYQAAN